MKVMGQEMVSIMMTMPTMVSEAVMNWVSSCWMVVEIVSMSVVVRERISPWVWVS